MDLISYCSSLLVPTAPSIELSAKIIELSAEEDMDKVLFSANGSDAVETALKLARQ